MNPRDQAENRFLLRRAERIFRELPASERRMLDQLITGFEGVLEMRDAAAIEETRRALKEFLNRVDVYGSEEDRPENEGPGHGDD